MFYDLVALSDLSYVLTIPSPILTTLFQTPKQSLRWCRFACAGSYLLEVKGTALEYYSVPSSELHAFMEHPSEFSYVFVLCLYKYLMFC